MAHNHGNTANRLILGLCVLQPVLSVASFWVNELGGNTNITLGIRFLTLLLAVGACFLLMERKTPLILLLSVGALFYCLHLFAIWQAGSLGIVSDITNYIRVLQLPLMTLALLTLLRQGKDGYGTMEKALTISFCFIMAVEVLSVLTGTNAYTYMNKQIGINGWFFNRSAQSAVLTMLLPPVLCAAVGRDQLARTCVVAAVGFGSLYFYATRLAYFSIFLIAFGMIGIYLITRGTRKRHLAVIFLCALLCGATFTLSPMKQNQDLVARNAERKQRTCEELTAKGIAEFGLDGTAYLTYVYDEYLGAMVDRFGLEDVAETYHYSTDASDLADVRRMKRTYSEMLLDRSPALSRWFGLSFGEMTWDGVVFDAENDFHGIVYLYGYVGLALLLVFLACFPIRFAIALFRNPKEILTPKAGAICLTLACGFLHALFTGGVLRRPDASFYLSLALAALGYFTRPTEVAQK